MNEPCRDPDHDHSERPGVVTIIPVSAVDADTSMQRRSVFRVGLTAAAAMAVLAGCKSGSSTTPPPYTPPPYTPPPYTPPPYTPPPTTSDTPPPSGGGGVYGGTGGGSGGGTGGSGGSDDDSGGGGTINEPCVPTPIPPGYTCTCNCVPS